MSQFDPEPKHRPTSAPTADELAQVWDRPGNSGAGVASLAERLRSEVARNPEASNRVRVGAPVLEGARAPLEAYEQDSLTADPLAGERRDYAIAPDSRWLKLATELAALHEDPRHALVFDWPALGQVRVPVVGVLQLGIGLLVLVDPETFTVKPKLGADLQFDLEFPGGHRRYECAKVLCERTPVPLLGLDILLLCDNSDVMEKNGRVTQNTPSVVSGGNSSHVDGAGEAVKEGEKSAAAVLLQAPEKSENFDIPREPRSP